MLAELLYINVIQSSEIKPMCIYILAKGLYVGSRNNSVATCKQLCMECFTNWLILFIYIFVGWRGVVLVLGFCVLSQ